MIIYSKEIERKTKMFYASLKEIDKRRFVGLEAEKLGRGGKSYLHNFLECDYKTITKGIEDLNLETIPYSVRSRKQGGGKKLKIKDARINEVFLEIISAHTAGTPTEDAVKWTYLNQEQIVELMKEKDVAVSRFVVKQLLAKFGFVKRKKKKKNALKEIDNRNEQFLNIRELRDLAIEEGCPAISLDTKNKESLGDYDRPNDAIYGIESQSVRDHNFKDRDTKTGIPHGIYDTAQNTGYITLNTSYDTSEFVCDNIKKWWLTIGILLYPLAHYILIMCDGGGSNSSRHYIFKEDLERLAKTIGIDIRIAHYPPYCSKWNPIEHRLFSQVSKAMVGAKLMNLEDMAKRIERTKTKTGLKVVVEINDKVYTKGRKYSQGYKENMTIEFDSFLPRWNYVAKTA